MVHCKNIQNQIYHLSEYKICGFDTCLGLKLLLKQKFNSNNLYQIRITVHFMFHSLFFWGSWLVFKLQQRWWWQKKREDLCGPSLGEEEGGVWVCVWGCIVMLLFVYKIGLFPMPLIHFIQQLLLIQPQPVVMTQIFHQKKWWQIDATGSIL